MEVVLVGTGSADGWPNPFCRCASCCAQQAAGELRRPTSALVDDTLLLDCGTGVPAAALAAGRPLDRLRAVLLTHDHPDHSAPMALLARQWTQPRHPLEVVGPAQVLSTWRPWCGPDDAVVFRPVTAGDVLDVAGYTVTVLPADHVQPAVLFHVQDGAGARLLYATDTGPLPDDVIRACAAAPVDLLLLEETFGTTLDHGTQHLDLGTFPQQLARLREAGGLREGCDVVAVHLSHYNPPAPRLVETLAAWGARPGADGEVLQVRAPAQGSAAPGPSGAGTATSGSGLPRRTLVLGGARSGKSTTAERLLAAEPSVTYVATGPAPQEADDGDAEAQQAARDWADRVRRHREQRPATWTTVEGPDAAAALFAADGPILLDCLGTWLTASMTAAGAWDDEPGWRKRVDDDVDALLDAWRRVRGPVVAVSNEVGSGVVPSTRAGGLFRDLLGRLNQRVADESESVLLVVAGRALRLDAAPGPPSLP